MSSTFPIIDDTIKQTKRGLDGGYCNVKYSHPINRKRNLTGEEQAQTRICGKFSFLNPQVVTRKC